MTAKKPHGGWLRHWPRLLFIIPFAAIMWVPSYNRIEPRLAGIPFFHWYQLAWIRRGHRAHRLPDRDAHRQAHRQAGRGTAWYRRSRRHPLNLSGFTVPGYAALYSVLVNSLVAVALAPVFELLARRRAVCPAE